MIKDIKGLQGEVDQRGAGGARPKADAGCSEKLRGEREERRGETAASLMAMWNRGLM